MNSITSGVRIALSFLFALAAPPLFAQGTFYEGPVSVAGIFNGNVTTGCSYDPLTHSAHRAIDDIVVPGSIGKYPLKMTRYYNSRAQYYAFTAIGLGPGWAHEYSWLLWGGHRGQSGLTSWHRLQFVATDEPRRYRSVAIGYRLSYCGIC